MLIKRYYDDLGHYLSHGKVLVLYGPRRVGKTTLLKTFLSKTGLKYKLDSGDNIRTQSVLGSQDFKQILEYAEGYELIAIDEAQQIPNIGMGLKIIVDQIPNIMVIATGSSSFDLAHQIGEPLTGRKKTLELFPFAQLELLAIHNKHELKEQLEDYLIYGSYPDVITARSKKEKRSVLQELVDSYLMKDILSLERIKNSKKLLDLLQLLAFQVGNEVSVHELATQVGIDSKTVNRYLDLLEKTFVLVRSGAFSRNLRNEISSKCKYYFLDNGVRNAIILQFNAVNMRDDVGKLWENFVVTERLKKRSYHELYANSYFWRTYSQKEIDLVEEREGNLFGYECKWSKPKRLTAPAEWTTAYPDASYEVITRKNYMGFIV